MNSFNISTQTHRFKKKKKMQIKTQMFTGKTQTLNNVNGSIK